MEPTPGCCHRTSRRRRARCRYLPGLPVCSALPALLCLLCPCPCLPVHLSSGALSAGQARPRAPGPLGLRAQGAPRPPGRGALACRPARGSAAPLAAVGACRGGHVYSSRAHADPGVQRARLPSWHADPRGQRARLPSWHADPGGQRARLPSWHGAGRGPAASSKPHRHFPNTLLQERAAASPGGPLGMLADEDLHWGMDVVAVRTAERLLQVLNGERGATVVGLRLGLACTV